MQRARSRRLIVSVFLAVALGGLVLFLQWSGTLTAASAAKRPHRGPLAETADLRNEPIQPIPLSVPVNEGLADLGRRLFHDRRLSLDETISCADCHEMAKAGQDGRRVSVGIEGKTGRRNAPTVFNSRYNFRQFWDGRAATLEEQVDGPLQDPSEMGATWDLVLHRLRADATYVADFNARFPDGITAPNVRTAIATFERSLITPNSRFDRWLRGDDQALTPIELKGYQLFKRLGCVACHQGRNVGGNLYQHFGVLRAPPESPTNEPVDLGRFHVTQKEVDRFKFKVPSLRNVERTAPYFHDGSVPTLDEAVRVMLEYQVGRSGNEAEVAAIVAFLKTLTGDTPDGGESR